jgi:3',5'-cyclic AMP phosphodiesterase CpdA
MHTLAHLSDLHFGCIDHTTVRPLIDTVQKIKPDLVAVSGDLTQRARSAQFREARAFLDALPGPQIVVPGNHDVPLYNLFARFLRPLSKYQRYITDDLEPFYADAQIAILGLNTASTNTTSPAYASGYPAMERRSLRSSLRTILSISPIYPIDRTCTTWSAAHQRRWKRLPTVA